MRAIAAAGLSVLALSLTLTAPAQASVTLTQAASRSVGTFRPGSGFYITTSGTDGLRQVGGRVRFDQAATNATINVSGRLTGLEANKLYVAVPYKDGTCLPLPGITAFPSGSFYTDSRGRARINGVRVNPQAINPFGSFNVRDTKSVSVRQAILSSVAAPGVPVGTPIVPNIVQPEACDKKPNVR